MKKIFFLLCLLAFKNSFATIYYVSTAGNDTYTGTSLTTPFLTVAKALTKAVAGGDIIYLRSGTYTMTARLNISKSGVVNNPITISAYPADLTSVYPIDGRPVFDFSALVVGSSSQGIQAKNAAYWNLYGLKIKGAGDNGMLVDNCNNFKIEYCDFTRNRDAGFQIRNLSHHCLILNCDSYENADLGAGTTTLGGNADGFAPKLDLGDSIIFRGCRAWLNSDDGWDGYLKAIESGVPDGMTTILENCWTWRNGYYWLDGTTNSSQNGNGFKLGGSANKDQAHNFIMVKCLSFYNKAKGFDQNNNAGSISLYNCTANKNGDNDFGLNSTGVTYAAGTLFTVKNCNSLGTKSTSFRSGTIKSNNSFSTATTSTNYSSIDTTGVSGKRKIDGSLPEIGYMHLALGTTLIDGGVLLPNVSYYDTMGIRYKGAAPDIGCFESNYPLPVVFTMYDIKYKKKELGIRSLFIENVWATATEINTSYFNVQRSTNGTNFETVGKINTKGASNYSFVDELRNLEFGIKVLYYRILVVDKDGNKTFSETRTLNFKPQTLHLFPNPAKDKTAIIFSVSKKQNVDIKVYDELGNCRLSLPNEVFNEGFNIKSINISALSKGNYIIKICYENSEIQTLKLLKQ